MIYSFGPYQLHAEARRLMRGEDVVAMSDRQFDVLRHLVASAGHVISKDALIAVAWDDIAVTDNSLEQIISAIRRTLGPAPNRPAYIETVARRGYRFSEAATITQPRQSDEALSALLAPYRALVDGRAALETLDPNEVMRAHAVFEEMTRTTPDYAPAHLGLANSLVLSFEAARAARRRPDAAMIGRARHHASEACRLDPASGEGWATLSLICHHSRDHLGATAAAQRAAALEPDNWRHHLRLAYVSWGEARLRAAHRVRTLIPAFPFAHWLTATVHVARQALDRADAELTDGAGAQDRQSGDAPFKSVGLHLLLGLVRLSAGNEPSAVEHFQRELGFDPSRHIYGRETAANAWCALGAIHLRHGRQDDAMNAMGQALAIMPGHAMALAGRHAMAQLSAPHAASADFDARVAELREQGSAVEAALAQAAYETILGHPQHAARIVENALAQAAAPGAGWSVPVEPLLHVNAHHGAWQQTLSLIRSRAI